MGTTLIKQGHNYVFGTNSGANSLLTSPPTPPTTETKYMEFSAQDYGYWNELYNSWNSNGKTVYQGSWEGYGNCRGVFKFSHVQAYLTSVTLQTGHTLTLTRDTVAGVYSPQNVYLCGTASTNIGSGSAPSITKSYGSIGTIDRGQTKTFTIPAQVATDLKAGTIKNLMVYVSAGGNYIKFSGIAKLRIKVRS